MPDRNDGPDESPPPEEGADQTTEPGNEGYDEDIWQRSIEESEVAISAGDVPPEAIPDEEDGPEVSGPLPELDELLKKVPESSRELIPSLFSGQFIEVRPVRWKRLF